MSTTTPTVPTLPDKVIARLRTVVPIAWGAVVAWVLTRVPAARSVLDGLGVDLADPAIVAQVQGAVTALVSAAWYWVWSKLGPHLPAWLMRLVLGSAATPTYGPPVRALSSTDQANLALLAAALDEGDPARAALQNAGVRPFTPAPGDRG